MYQLINSCQSNQYPPARQGASPFGERRLSTPRCETHSRRGLIRSQTASSELFQRPQSQISRVTNCVPAHQSVPARQYVPARQIASSFGQSRSSTPCCETQFRRDFIRSQMALSEHPKNLRPRFHALTMAYMSSLLPISRAIRESHWPSRRLPRCHSQYP